MSKPPTYFTLLISLTIAFTLMLSSLHSHEQLSWNKLDEDLGIEHQISASSPLCPICGYIVKTDFWNDTAIEICFQELITFSIQNQSYIGSPLLDFADSRAPPFYA